MPSHFYIHLPYCRRKCPYCDFFKLVPHSGERERYVEAALQEMALAHAQYSEFAGPAATVYFGGGTPSLHSPQEIAALIQRIRELWGIVPGAEITLEANPGTLITEIAAGWHDAGINRLSLGAQSFSARKLKLLYRDHTASEITDAVNSARAAGLESLSLDLIFGLPDENLEELRSDLASLVALQPQHVSLYNLEFHAGTPFDRWRASGKLVPLDADLEADLYLEIHETLAREGYEHYEVSNFARPGFRAVHNQAYWINRPYLGLGASAHSYNGHRLRFSNVADIHRYFAAIELGKLPVAESHANTPREQQEEWISNSLRRVDGILKSDAIAILGDAITRALWQRARELPAALYTLTDDRFALTPAGWFRENSVLLWLFEGLS
jgi:oxygen-independent coproporphyrinogen III oxidase